jgi:hypothetical protein
MNSIDLTTKNASIAIVILLDLLFFIAALAAAMSPSLITVSTKLWELFYGTNGGLLLLLNGNGRSTPPPDPPTSK